MNKIIAAVITTSLIGFGANAIAGKPHGANGMAKIFKDAELALTPDQLESIKAIRKSHKATKDASQASGSKMKISDLDKTAPDYDDQVAQIKAEKMGRKEAMLAKKEAIQAEISAVLTPQQQERFEALMSEHNEKKAKKRHKSYE